MAERLWIWASVGYGQNNNSVRIVQDTLNREFGGIEVDGWWGDQTKNAYSRWQLKLYPGASTQPGGDADGHPGLESLRKLGTKYGFDVKTDQEVLAPGEPAHDYTRTTHGGRTVNKRTDVMLYDAQSKCGMTFTLSQGSYSSGVSASAGTHDGGGVVDVSVSSMSASQRSSAILALRKAGFAAWLRTPNEGFAYHIHACAIGDREMAPAAKDQVRSYFNGRNGLANNGPDSFSGGRPYPAWAAKYK